MAQIIPDAAEICRFWFVEAGPQKWFAKDTAFDQVIATRFADVLQQEEACRGWCADGQDILSYILLCDQFPRNIFRGRAQAFAWDERARAAARTVLERGWDRDHEGVRRTFLYLPFMHSEDVADQDVSVRLFDALGNENGQDYARRHRDIVVRFGRFPHRNAALGRVSTAEEEAFLRQPGSSF